MGQRLSKPPKRCSAKSTVACVKCGKACGRACAACVTTASAGASLVFKSATQSITKRRRHAAQQQVHVLDVHDGPSQDPTRTAAQTDHADVDAQHCSPEPATTEVGDSVPQHHELDPAVDDAAAVEEVPLSPVRRKLRRCEFAEGLDHQVLEPFFSQGDRFYEHFLAVEVGQSSVKDVWCKTIVQFELELAKLQHRLDLVDESRRRRQLRELLPRIQDAVEDHGELTVSLVFSKANPTSGDSLDARVHRGMANWFFPFGAVHAGICINNCILLEWGEGARATPSLTIAREIDPKLDVRASLLVMRKSLRDPGVLSDAMMDPDRPLDDVCNHIRACLGQKWQSGPELRRCVEADLRAISDVACEWNRNKRFNQISCNCQHFANALLGRLGGIRVDLSAPVLTQYLRQIADGTLWETPQEWEQGMLCFNWKGTRHVFETADELDAFIAARRHDDMPHDAHYLLGSFHELFERRANHYPTECRWHSHGYDALPAGFDWDRFTDNAAMRMGALIKRY